MVKNMIVVFSAMALIITSVGMADAWVSGMPGCVTVGDMITIPMKVKTVYKKAVGSTMGGDSTLLVGGGEDWWGVGGYDAAAGFRPWGPWRRAAVECKVQIIPPKCVAPQCSSPVALGAAPCLPPGAKLLCNEEKFQLRALGSTPCVDGGVRYSIEKTQSLGFPGPPPKAAAAAPKGKGK
jgi:hypothetical protein